MFKIIHIALAAILMAIAAVPPAKAAGTSGDLQEKKSRIQSGIQELQGKESYTNNEIKRLVGMISETTGEINANIAEVQKSKLDIDQLNKEVTEIKERMAKRKALLKERARAIQQSGGNADYLEVLLGSKSFGDFVERMSAVSTIMEADQKILKEQESDEKKLEQDEKKLADRVMQLQNQKKSLQQKKEQQKQQLSELEKTMKQLKTKEKELHEEKMSLKEQEELLASQQSAADRAAKMDSSHGDGGVPAISSGSFTRPAEGVLSSNFGARWGTRHMGVDIANPGSNVPIVASADGVVIRSYLSSSYGNAVFISHSINGQKYTTVYAHMKSRKVSSGQTVKKGQQIGVMGSTGESTGQHLHFELHKGEWNAAKTNAINPIGIVPF